MRRGHSPGTLSARDTGRVCKDEGGATPPAANQFSSFVKLTMECEGVGAAERTYALEEITSVGRPEAWCDVVAEDEQLCLWG